MLLMGKVTISMAIFNSYVKLPEGTYIYISHYDAYDSWLSHAKGAFFIPPFLSYPHCYPLVNVYSLLH